MHNVLYVLVILCMLYFVCACVNESEEHKAAWSSSVNTQYIYRCVCVCVCVCVCAHAQSVVRTGDPMRVLLGFCVCFFSVCICV